MKSDLDNSSPPKRRWRAFIFSFAAATSALVLSGLLLWDNRGSVAEIAIINFFESKGIQVKGLTVSKAETDGFTIQNLHLYRNGDIKVDRVAAHYSIQGLQEGRIDSFEIINTTYARAGAKALLVIGRTVGDAKANREDPLDGSALKMSMTKIKVTDQPIQSAKFKTEIAGGIAKSQLIVQVDLTRLQINSETELNHNRWPTKFTVDSLFYIKEITQMMGLNHAVSGWLTVKAQGTFRGIHAFLGDEGKDETLEASASIELRARQLANIFGLSEGMAGSDKLSLDIINVRATPKFARARFKLYSYITGRVTNLFTYQNAKINLEAVATSDQNEAKIRIEKGNLAIDLPIYFGDVFFRDQVEVGLHSLKNYIRYKYKDGAIDYRLKLQPLPIFISIPTHRATVRTNWDLDKITAESEGDGRHVIRMTVHDVRVPTYALKASDIGLDATIENGRTNFALSVAKLEQTDQTPILVPVSLTAKAINKDGALKGKFQATAPNTGLKFNAEFYNDYRSFKGNLKYKLAQLNFGPSGDDIKNISPLLAIQLKSVLGKITVSGGSHWRAGSASNDYVQVRLDELGVQAEAASVSRINGTLALSSIDPSATEKLQKLTALLNVGDLKPVPLEINWRLNRNGALALQPFIARFAGGTLSTNTVIFHPNTERETFSLAVDKVDVTEIFRLAGIEGLSGTGKLSGTIPIKIEGKKVIVKSGKLAAVGPGIIRFDGGPVTKSLEKKGDTVAMALKTLSNFRYQTMTVGLEKLEDGTGSLKLSMKGSNPKVYQGHPFIFNINLESNFDNLAKFALQGLETADNVLKWAGGKYGLEPRNPQTGKKLR